MPVPMPNLSDCAGRLIRLLCLSFLLAACARPQASPPPVPPVVDELTFYNWAEYMPQAVLTAFTEEYGVRINYVAYEGPEEAVRNILAGDVYDVVVLPPEAIPQLIANGRLAEIDYANVPNFKYVSASFRDLVYDPENRHSVPFHYGTTGLLVRTDLIDRPVTRWADLWDPRYAGQIALWKITRDLIPIALKSLGYQANSVNPEELAAAQERLLELKPNVIWWDTRLATIVPALTSGDAVIAYGWAYDAQVAREQSADIEYILPEEGTFLWSDNFVIPANSPHKRTAELFLDFILRPEISAQIINESFYPLPNDAARPLVIPEILNDPIIYPPDDELRTAEVIVPISQAGENLYSYIEQVLWGASQ